MSGEVKKATSALSLQPPLQVIVQHLSLCHYHLHKQQQVKQPLLRLTFHQNFPIVNFGQSSDEDGSDAGVYQILN